MAEDDRKPLSAGAVAAWTAVTVVTLGLFVGTLMIRPPKKR